MPDSADLDTPVDQILAGNVDVVNDQDQALDGLLAGSVGEGLPRLCESLVVVAVWPVCNDRWACSWGGPLGRRHWRVFTPRLGLARPALRRPRPRAASRAASCRP